MKTLVSILLMLSVSFNTLLAVTDDNQQAIRENPSIAGDTMTVTNEYGYDFINYKANHINMNGTVWTTKCGTDKTVSIVHIGDSHIQADGATGVVRSLLQKKYGNAGRGLITPLKLSGTNEPRDYSMRSQSQWSTSKLFPMRWGSEMGFTGVCISPQTAQFDLSISTISKSIHINPFKKLRIFCSGDLFVNSITSRGNMVLFESHPADGYVDVLLDSTVTDVNLNMSSLGYVYIYGVSLISGETGVFYHIIGNNGATFDSYNRVGNVGSGITNLSPDLVILSMGANEAFGSVSDENFYNMINRLVTDIKKNNPNADLLLITPMECQRSTTVYTRRTKKSKRTSTKSYTINQNVQRLRQVILKYGQDNNVPTYDWYDIAGGPGASTHWLSKSLMGRDRIHNTWAGYELQGKLLYDALIEKIGN